MAGQMSMLEKVEDNGYTSPDASIKFSYEDGAIKYAGQFFTPYSVCQAMSEISFDPARFEDIGFVSVNDCACGAGACRLMPW